MTAPTRPVLRHYGNRTFRDPDPSQIARFNLSRFRVDEATGCHVWLGALKKGYAIVGTNDWGAFRVARLVFIRDKGPIPLGLYPDHTCRNRPCINSEHLELVTNAENTRRGDKAKLSWDDVREIRRVYAEGEATFRQLAARFGVSSCAISNIVNLKRWKEVEHG